VKKEDVNGKRVEPPIPYAPVDDLKVCILLYLLFFFFFTVLTIKALHFDSTYLLLLCKNGDASLIDSEPQIIVADK
jgi:hypothetical protein